MPEIDLGYVRGPQGLQGETGPEGPQGVQGPQGATGATGPQGPIGVTGPQGIKGDKGDKGDQGAQGPQGERGPGSSPNLLDNWYFPDPVNQRNVLDWPGEWTWGIDRWRNSGTSSAQVKPGIGVLLNENAVMIQYLEPEKMVAGQLYTASVLTSGNELLSTTFIANPHDGWVSLGYAELPSGFGLRVAAENGVEWSMTLYGNGSNVTVIAAKLELGDTQTLAHKDASGNWVLNDIPDKALELAKCQRYFQRYVGNGAYCGVFTYDHSAAQKYTIFIPTPVSMRTTPSVTIRGTFDARSATGEYVEISFDNNEDPVKTVGVTNNGVTLWPTLNSADFSQDTMGLLGPLASDGELILNAEF